MIQIPFQQASLSRRWAFGLLAFFWLAARMPVFLGSFGATFDLESYGRVADALRHGQALYGNPELQGRYPYLPAWGVVLWALSFFSSWTGLTLTLAAKLMVALADLGITLLLFLILERLLDPRQAVLSVPWWARRSFWAALAYAVNPLSLLVGAAHGQFDSVALFFIILAAWYFEFSQNTLSDLFSALSLGIAISFKSWPFFLLPLFLKHLNLPSQRGKFLVLSLLPSLLLLLIFSPTGDWQAVLKALGYSGSQALSLPAAIKSCFYACGAAPETYRAFAGAYAMGALACFLALWGLYSLSAMRLPLLSGLALGVLTLYIFAAGLATQYLLWLLPFALLLPGRLALKHTAVSLTLLLLFYGMFLPETFLRPGTWAPLEPPRWTHFLWAVINLGLWVFFLSQWVKLFRFCRMESR